MLETARPHTTRTTAFMVAVATLLAGGLACVPKPPPPAPVVEESPYPDDFACEEGTLPVGLPPPGGTIIWCQMQTTTGHVLRHGPSIEWHANGRRSKQGGYLQGKLDGKWSEWHATGDLSKEITYANGVMEGPFVEYFLDGTKQAEGQMVNGKESGQWTYWTEGTGARLLGTYADGKRSGTWLQYNATGVPVRERSYRAGRLMSQRELVPTEAPDMPSIQVHTGTAAVTATKEPPPDLLEDADEDLDLDLPDDISELPEATEDEAEPPPEESPEPEAPADEAPADEAEATDDAVKSRPDDGDGSSE